MNQEPATQPSVMSGKHFMMNDLATNVKPTWCPGCGDFSIWLALKNALVKNDVPLERICIVYGIGCHGHMCCYLNVYGFEGLHGRPIPVAEGIKIANDSLRVIVIAGDGDTYGEGMNHFISGLRGNHDVTMIVHNNMVYGLTTGQTSPTSLKGYKSKSTPDGVIEVPVNPIVLALAAGGGFVSRGFSGNVNHLTDLISTGMAHRGFAFIDVLQNCVSFNNVNTIAWFNQRVYDLAKEGHDTSDKTKAMAKAFEFGDRIPIGIFYQDKRETYEDDLVELKSGTLLSHPLAGRDLTKVFERFV
jgi:2-oxoglutarate ferredoxin oxidoreductase subunit beta